MNSQAGHTLLFPKFQFTRKTMLQCGFLKKNVQKYRALTWGNIELNYTKGNIELQQIKKGNRAPKDKEDKYNLTGQGRKIRVFTAVRGK